MNKKYKKYNLSMILSFDVKSMTKASIKRNIFLSIENAH